MLYPNEMKNVTPEEFFLSRKPNESPYSSITVHEAESLISQYFPR